MGYLGTQVSPSRLWCGKAAQMNLKNTIQQERTRTRAPIKASVRNQYLEDIKAAQSLEQTAKTKKAQTQVERETNNTRTEF
jgi:hypothetical protein